MLFVDASKLSCLQKAQLLSKIYTVANFPYLAPLGSGGFDLYGGGHKDSMSGFGSFGGGGHMKRGPSGSSLLSTTGTHADAVIAKINQRLDMLTQLEGGFKGSRADR